MKKIKAIENKKALKALQGVAATAIILFVLSFLKPTKAFEIIEKALN